MKSSLGDKQRLIHIQEAIKEIEDYTENTDFEIFRKNSMMKFATVKQLEIIGEAANHISDETKKNFPEVAWREITGLRNFLVHGYFGVDETLIWQIVTVDIPSLKNQLINIQ